MDDWESGERHLVYTIIAVTAILALGAITVPMTLSANEPLPTSKRELLATRYVEAITKVKGSSEPVPTVEEAARAFGETGGTNCSEPIVELHKGFIVRPKGRPSYLDRVAMRRLRVAMRIYCPPRDVRYGAWLKARGI